ncbi:hypothetical protein NL50_12790 [Clostridium acetobutylicum]|nr:hypothetical protein NL50_12790 [Clostridium acetobutylicum]
MNGYRDHSIRTSQFYCPYFNDKYIYSQGGYRQKVEEYPAQYQSRPQSPPPDYIPRFPTTTYNAIASGIISPCNNKYTYLWLKNGEAFWSYIAYVGTRSISGWRYDRGRWVQFGLNLVQIRNFTCI